MNVTGDNGTLTIQSDGDITLKAASLSSAGSLDIDAGKSLHISTLNTQNREHYNGNADNYYRLDQQGEIGSTLRAKEGFA